MGHLVFSTQMTLDGVIDHDDEWFSGDGEHEGRGAYDELFAAEAILLGRKTYEGLAAYWPTSSDTSGFADRLNGLPKFVASRTLAERLDWNATLIKGDPADYVAELKRQYRGNLLSYGCGSLAHYLASRGLVDEVCFWVHPVVFGSGQRPFHGSVPVWLQLTSTTMFRSGVALLSYKPTPGLTR
jgi:dihydrofolate reductase